MAEKYLYQPITNKNIEKNKIIVRNCKDRSDAMISFCKKYFKKDFSNQTFFDIGTAYGYFMNTFGKYCKGSYGIENNKLHLKNAQLFYPEEFKNIIQEDFTDYLLEIKDREYDIVASLSSINTYFRNDSTIKPEEIIKEIDRITSKVLFFEMGQGHEDWYKKDLPGWDEEKIKSWLLDNTTFDFCEPIIKDSDSVGDFAENYGRTIFVCYRND